MSTTKPLQASVTRTLRSLRTSNGAVEASVQFADQQGTCSSDAFPFRRVIPPLRQGGGGDAKLWVYRVVLIPPDRCDHFYLRCFANMIDKTETRWWEEVNRIVKEGDRKHVAIR